MRQAYASQPGDTQPSEWNGKISASSDIDIEIDDIAGYRFEFPNRVLPQGGWRMKTNLDKILSSSPVEGSGVSSTVVMPKGLLVSGRGDSYTNLSLDTNHGSCTVSPIQLVAGAIKEVVS
jgi:hypothetical protein